MIIVLLILIVIAILVAMIKGLINYLKAKPVAIDSDSTHKLYELFCNEVKNVLKAPTTAVFCQEHELQIKENKGIYFISGWVDSQNSFGAMIRTQINNFKISNLNGVLIPKSNIKMMTVFKLFGNLTACYIIGIIATIVSFFVLSSVLF